MKRFINRHPKPWMLRLLGLLPFVMLVIAYFWGSDIRLTENPQDKLMPSIHSFGAAIERMALNPDLKTGTYLFWDDSVASLRRLLLGIFCSALMGLVFSIFIGLFPEPRVMFTPIVTVFSLVPPMAILPILFIMFGLGELSKVVLIIIGTLPFIIRDLQQRVLEIPSELLVKAQTLNASSWQIILRLVLPQILPRLLEALRLSLGAAWLFLIAAEAVAATEGLGYRIFLMRRYLAMDIILPYVFWITALAFAMDFSLKKLSYLFFPWYHQIASNAKTQGQDLDADAPIIDIAKKEDTTHE